MDSQLKNSQINVSCVSYQNDKLDSNITLYTIQMQNKNGQTWTLDKRFSQFDELHKKLKEYFGENLPSLPKKSYITFLVSKTQDDLEIRKFGLDSYLKNLVVRPEVFNSLPLREFLEIDRYASDAVANPPQFLYEYLNFIHGVRDFIFNNDQKVFFVIDSDMNVLTRIDSYLTNMRMPWEKDNTGDPTIMPVGCVECFIMNKNGSYERTWTKVYSAQAICLYWDSLSCTLLVGLDNGNLNMLTVPQQDLNFTRYEESLEIESHSLRIMGVYYDSIRSLIHTVSKDKKYRVLNIKKQILVADYEPSDFELTYLLVNAERKKSFIADRNGSIFIFDTDDSKPKPLIHLASNLNFVRGLVVDSQKNYLLAIGYESGQLNVYDIGKPGKEGFAKEVAQLRNKQKSREICWSSSRGEVFIGNDDGTITIWNAKKAEIIYVLKAHDKPVTKLQWFDESSILMTGSKDKSIKAWKFPENWRDKKLLEQEEREEQIQQKTENILQMQRKLKQKDKDSDEDELEQWHKETE